MDTYCVDIYTELDEYFTITVQAYNPIEAEAIAQTMVENGDVDCLGRIAVSCNAYQG